MARRTPAKKPTNASEARRTNVLLEEIHAQFKSFGEGLTSVRERLDRIEPTVSQTAKDVELLSGWARKFSLELQALRADVGTLKADVSELKKDMKDIKGRLTAVEAG